MMRIAFTTTLIVMTLTSLAVAAADRQAVSVTSALQPVMPMSTDGLSAVEKDVVAADASWGTAYQTCDMKLMGNLLHNDIVFIHLHARVDRKPAMMKEFGGCPNEYALTEPIHVRMIGKEAAIVEGNMKLRAKGQKDLLQILYTRVYIHEGGAWRMIAHQSTMNPGLDPAGKPLAGPALRSGGAAIPASGTVR